MQTGNAHLFTPAQGHQGSRKYMTDSHGHQAGGDPDPWQPQHPRESIQTPHSNNNNNNDNNVYLGCIGSHFFKNSSKAFEKILELNQLLGRRDSIKEESLSAASFDISEALPSRFTA
ncbi:unnamed protein product [Merluccius merluccius]